MKFIHLLCGIDRNCLSFSGEIARSEDLQGEGFCLMILFISISFFIHLVLKPHLSFLFCPAHFFCRVSFILVFDCLCFFYQHLFDSNFILICPIDYYCFFSTKFLIQNLCFSIDLMKVCSFAIFFWARLQLHSQRL